MPDRACTPKQTNFKPELWRMHESVGDVEFPTSDHQEGPISTIRWPTSTFYLVTWSILHLLLSLNPASHRQWLPGQCRWRGECPRCPQSHCFLETAGSLEAYAMMKGGWWEKNHRQTNFCNYELIGINLSALLGLSPSCSTTAQIYG